MSGRQRIAPRAKYRQLGPGACVCLECGKRISSNALAKAGHESGKGHLAAIYKKTTPPKRENILEVLEENTSRCCDDETDRQALADALVNSLSKRD